MTRNSGDLGLDLAYPSRGPTGDVWFVLTTDMCLSVLYRIDSNTGRLSLALKRCGLRILYPTQSPDGKSLAYRIEEPGIVSGANALVIRDLATGRERGIQPLDRHGHPGTVPRSIVPKKLTRTLAPHQDGLAVRAPDVPRFYGAPAWSLDSRRIAIDHLPNFGYPSRLEIMDATTDGQVRQLLGDIGSREPRLHRRAIQSQCAIQKSRGRRIVAASRPNQALQIIRLSQFRILS